MNNLEKKMDDCLAIKKMKEKRKLMKELNRFLFYVP